MRIKSVVVLAASVLGTVTLAAQTNLERMVNEAQAGWLLGRWVGTSQEGQQVAVQFQWALDRQIVLVRSSIGDVNALGIVSVDPITDTVKYVSFDNKGGRANGTWDVRYDGVELRLEGVNGEGRSWKAAVVFSQKGTNQMEVRVYGVDQWGYAVEPAKARITLEKQQGVGTRRGNRSSSGGN